MKKHLIFNLIIALFVSLLIVWISKSRLDDFYNYHSVISSESTASASSEISRFISEKQYLVNIFGNDHINLLTEFTNDPENEHIYNRLEHKISLYFPDYFSFTVTRPDGEPFLYDFEGFVGDQCMNDLREFAQTGKHSPRIHPNSFAYHFDIITKLKLNNQKIILFISFHTDVLGNILQSAQTNGHQLMLIDTSLNNLIEAIDKGARTKVFRQDYRLKQDELDRILSRKVVNNTRWTAVDLYNESLFSTHRNNIMRSGISIMLLFVVISLIMTIIIYRKEKLRLEAEKHKDEFLSVVSHELRTPITSIFGSLSLLSNEVTGELSEESKKLTQVALTNCDRLNLLINDLLDIQKIEAGKMDFNFEDTRIDLFIKQCIESNTGYAQKMGVSYELVQPVPEITLTIDQNRIAQIMANLLSNAAKFGAPNDHIKILIHRDNDYVRVSVVDHGEGIPEQFKHRVFEKFAQSEMSTTRNASGTGLGLCIVKAIVEEHGGSVGFISSEGKGSTFYFDLPINAQQV